MNETLAFYATRTVPGFPLGQPHDGRPRYGMTPEQAALYRWLVTHKPHNSAFGINFREAGWRLARHFSKVHMTVQALIERGWLKGQGDAYAFVHPVMQFKAPRDE